ncbi:unnamed protein product [Calypogeia fissa]
MVELDRNLHLNLHPNLTSQLWWSSACAQPSAYPFAQCARPSYLLVTSPLLARPPALPELALCSPCCSSLYSAAARPSARSSIRLQSYGGPLLVFAQAVATLCALAIPSTMLSPRLLPIYGLAPDLADCNAVRDAAPPPTSIDLPQTLGCHAASLPSLATAPPSSFAPLLHSRVSHGILCPDVALLLVWLALL